MTTDSQRKPNFLSLVYLLLCLLIVSSCTSDRTNQQTVQHDYPEQGIRLEKSAKWEAEFYERNGTLYLSSSDWDGETTIHLRGSYCDPSLPNPYISANEDIDVNIERLIRLYEPRPVTTIASISQIENENYEVWTSAVTVADSDDFNKIDFTIRLFHFSDSKDLQQMVYVYEGDSERLNQEAFDIIQSVRWNCIELTVTPN